MHNSQRNKSLKDLWGMGWMVEFIKEGISNSTFKHKKINELINIIPIYSILCIDNLDQCAGQDFP